MISLFLGHVISHKPINVTTRNYTTISNFDDLFNAMQVHFNSTNLTQDVFIKVTNSSAASLGESNRVNVDCIARHPVDYYLERFVSSPTNFPTDHYFMVDFLTSKVHLRNYTLLYISEMRFMVQYEVLASIWAIGKELTIGL